MKKDYLIRKAQPPDARGIHEVILAAFEQYRNYYSIEGFTDTVMSEEIALERMKEMTIYIAIDGNGKIIGTIGWKKVSKKEGHIRGMAVLPDRQGKNSPAAELMQIVEDDAQSQGCSFLTLDTTAPLQRAQNFYRKHGFKKTGKTSDFYGSLVYEFAKKI
ncbi:MAG: GNAT family N-acetyltransferase [Candidatus Thorarchaeota archaeon]